MRKPIGFRQLCMVAREILTADRRLDDTEWRERIKDRIIALGYTYPQPWSLLTDAMTQVERALERRWGPRPPPLPPVPPPRDPDRGSPWHIPRQRTDQGAWMGPARILPTLAEHVPEAVAAMRKAAASPAVRRAIRAAQARELAEAAQAAQEPSTEHLRRLQAAIEALRASRRLREAAGDGTPDGDVHGDRRAAAEGIDEGVCAEVVGGESRRHG
jgi:hypothetical protein